MTTDAENLEYALVMAASAGDLYRVEHLLSVGAPVDARGKRGWTALQMANAGSDDVRKLLLQRGADINACDDFGLTALHHDAQDDEFVERLHWLLDHGAQVNAQGKAGETPLCMAVQSSQHQCCQLLLDRGANIEAKNNEGLSPLGVASDYGNLSMCRLLIANGACTKDIKKQSTMMAQVMDMSPLEAAASLGGVQLLQKVLERDQDPNSLCARVIQAMDVAKKHGCPAAETLMRSWLARTAAHDALDEIQTLGKPGL